MGTPGVYRIDPDGKITRLLGPPDTEWPNGLVISPDDRTLYLGEALMMLGLCFMIGTPAAVGFWVVLNAMQVARARIEESKLSRQFPEYRAYQKRTRFLIPGVY